MRSRDKIVILFMSIFLICTLLKVGDVFCSSIDPFKPFIKTVRPKSPKAHLLPIQRVKLSELTLKGIIYSPENPMALINDASGKAYIIKVGDPIGPLGHVKFITKSKVIVEEVYTDVFEGRKTRIVELSLPQKEGRKQ